ILAYQHNGEPCDFSGLDKRDSFKQFVHGSKSSRHNNVALGVFHKHDLSNKKIVELQEFIPSDIFIVKLFKWQLNVESYGFSSGLVRTLIGGLHDTWPASCNDTIALFG